MKATGKYKHNNKLYIPENNVFCFRTKRKESHESSRGVPQFNRLRDRRDGSGSSQISIRHLGRQHKALGMLSHIKRRPKSSKHERNALGWLQELGNHG